MIKKASSERSSEEAQPKKTEEKAVYPVFLNKMFQGLPKKLDKP